MSFKDFKNKMKSDDSQSKLKSAFEEKSYEDTRYWKPTLDKDGRFSGVIRFLPAGNDEENYYVSIYSYGFQSKKTNQWYIENSLQTIGEKDPVKLAA